MTTNMCRCGQPAPDSTICPNCQTRLSVALKAIPALADETLIVLARLTKTSGNSVGYVTGSSTRPLPYDVAASEKISATKSTLVAWARMVSDESITARPLRDSTITGLSRYLLREADWLGQHTAAADAVTEITAAVAGLRRVAYRQAPERHYRGPCTETWRPDPQDLAEACCVADLHAIGDLTTITCTQCGSRHNSADRRQWLLEQAADKLYTQTELAALLRITVERAPSRSTLAHWVRKGRLLAHTVTPDGRALYLMGDALQLVAQRAA